MMEYKGYVGDIEYDHELGIFHGRVVGLRDVITFQGATAKTLDRAFRVSIDDYIAFCGKRGELPEKPLSGKFIVRTTPELHRRLAVIARKKGLSVNKAVHEAMVQYVAKAAKAD
jgi:predicted HicB family RNase H-like nuclease